MLRIARLHAGLLPFVLAAALLVSPAAADSKSIYNIQYTTAADGASPEAGNIIACLGGIVTHKYPGSKPKLTLQDPANPDGWGAIQVKDWTAANDLFAAVAVGEWVSLANVEVEEYRGNTLLRYHADNSPSFAIDSSGNALPASRLVSLSEIAAPTEGPPGEWYVADHSAEQYEAMRLTVENVTVTAMDLGKAVDNYALSATGQNCWASDYMNADRDSQEDYHARVGLGEQFPGVAGILEQYTKDNWDYYQLLTRQTADFLPEPALATILLAAGAVLLRRPRSAQRAIR